ncbi:MAG: LysM peptidoglycan-binding domain-containing protein [Firmicutes bacterium]|nr:LysM peptidoglycan-binding domain-containing protein [Bacillota bacterium]
MENIIPFTKEIKFDNKIIEITSISLEEKYNCTNDSIDGEFKVFGEYRSHELSINKEKFEYKLPFSVDLAERIKEDTLSFEITDFSYDILNEDILKINIEFKIDAEKEEVIEETCDDPLELIEDRNSIIKNNIEEKIVEPKEEVRINKQDEDTIIDSINTNDIEFTTYHIHIVKESETIESICALYNSNEQLLADYNDLTDFKVGDKLIVVESDE